MKSKLKKWDECVILIMCAFSILSRVASATLFGPEVEGNRASKH